MKSKKSIQYVALLAICMMFSLQSCTQPFKDCVAQWEECKSGCPEVDVDAWEECLSNCNPPDVPIFEDPAAWDAFNACLRACGNPYTARELCLKQCDERLQDCIEAL
jgi:hypothetical protein